MMTYLVFVCRVKGLKALSFEGQKSGFVLRCHLFLNLKSLNPIGRIKELMRQLRQTEEHLDQSRREKQRLEDENARLREENTRLRKELETAQRAAKRQARQFADHFVVFPGRAARKPTNLKSPAIAARHHIETIGIDIEDRNAGGKGLGECFAARGVDRVVELGAAEIVSHRHS
jgi:hypothetical protein